MLGRPRWPGPGAFWCAESYRVLLVILLPLLRQGDHSGVCSRQNTEGINSEQAHVPAEQPSARKDPRLPASHADPCWSRGPLLAPVQGARPPVGIRFKDEHVLAVGHRLRRRDEFAAVIKAGRRAGRGCLVVHVLTADQSPGRESGQVIDASLGNLVRIGFVVPRAVGNAVARNRVRRRLRHLLHDRLAAMPPGTDVVVRVSAGATTRSYAQLGADLDAAIAAAPNTSRGRKARSSA
jgi:ribonuclease P protein component